MVFCSLRTIQCFASISQILKQSHPTHYYSSLGGIPKYVILSKALWRKSGVIFPFVIQKKIQIFKRHNWFDRRKERHLIRPSSCLVYRILLMLMTVFTKMSFLSVYACEYLSELNNNDLFHDLLLLYFCVFIKFVLIVLRRPFLSCRGWMGC